MDDSDIRLCVLAFCGGSGQEIGAALKPSRQRGKTEPALCFHWVCVQIMCVCRGMYTCEIALKHCKLFCVCKGVDFKTDIAFVKRFWGLVAFWWYIWDLFYIKVVTVLICVDVMSNTNSNGKFWSALFQTPLSVIISKHWLSKHWLKPQLKSTWKIE